MEEDQKWRVTDTSNMQRTCSEQQPCKKPLWRNWRDLSGITICITLSLLSLGVCVLVFLRTSELQSRIVNLEKQRDTQLSSWISLEQVEPVILGRLDQILEEVSGQMATTINVCEIKHPPNHFRNSIVKNKALQKRHKR